MYKIIALCLIGLACLTRATAQDQNISNGAVFEGEPFLAVNPINPQHVVVAWMGFVASNGPRLSIKVRSSFNGGATWGNTVRMPHVVPTYKSADPSMVFDAQGNLFLSYIDYRESPDSGGVYLFKSVDGGLSWGAPVLMLDAYADGSKRPIDRPWLTIDASGNHLFLTTKPAPWVPAPNRPYFTHSSNGGQTWQPWRYIDGPGNLVGNLIQAPMAAPAVSGSTFYAAFPSYVPAQNLFPQFLLASSKNYGLTMSYSAILSASQSSSNDTAKLAYKLLADPSDTNHLAFLYPYQPFGDIDVMLTETFNAGASWTVPLRVNDDPQGNGKMQDLIWADFDTDGDLIVAWRDRRNGAGSGYANASEYFAAFRKKGAAGFQPNFKLSTVLVPYNNILSQNGNDFMGIALRDDILSAVWGNTRDGSLDIWYVRASALTGNISSVSQLEGAATDLLVYPNPSSGVFQLEMPDRSGFGPVQVLNESGDIIQTIQSAGASLTINLKNEPPGVYFLQVQHDGKPLWKRLVKI